MVKCCLSHKLMLTLREKRKCVLPKLNSENSLNWLLATDLLTAIVYQTTWRTSLNTFTYRRSPILGKRSTTHNNVGKKDDNNKTNHFGKIEHSGRKITATKTNRRRNRLPKRTNLRTSTS